MEWNKATVLQFIKEYYNCPLLWDQNNEDHKNFLKRKVVIDQLGQKFGLSPIKVKDKIANLKRQFNREISKIEKNKKNDIIYTPRWFAFKYLNFLIKCNDYKIGYEQNMVLIPDDDTEYTENLETCYTSIYYDESDEIDDRVSNSMNICSTTSKITEEGKLDHTSRALIQCDEKLNLQKDEFSIYAEHVAWQLRKLKHQQVVAKARLKIEEVLFKAVTEDCNLQVPNSHINRESSLVQKPSEQHTEVEVINLIQ